MSRSPPPHLANRTGCWRHQSKVMMRALAPALALLGATALSATQASAPAADGAFASFFHAGTAREAAAASDRIVASGVGFDEAFGRLRQGRLYSRDVPRGVVQGSYRSETGEYFYTLDVPERYDPARKYQVRVQLHGGVGRIEANTPPRSGSNGRLPGVEQIYVMPYAWRDAPWWTGRQVENLRAILDVVKRTYNVDENRIVLSGVSDGGTGAYYVAMRDTTPFASFLPLNGFLMVLAAADIAANGPVFPNNLRDKPFFIVNGERDPLYPARTVDPYVEHMKRGGVALDYRPQAGAGHNTAWWPQVRETYEAFVREHPRNPLPDSLTWETHDTRLHGRAHWLVIDTLGKAPGEAASLTDLNRFAGDPIADFGARSVGSHVTRV